MKIFVLAFDGYSIVVFPSSTFHTPLGSGVASTSTSLGLQAKTLSITSACLLGAKFTIKLITFDSSVVQPFLEPITNILFSPSLKFFKSDIVTHL